MYTVLYFILEQSRQMRLTIRFAGNRIHVAMTTALQRVTLLSVFL